MAIRTQAEELAKALSSFEEVSLVMAYLSEALKLSASVAGAAVRNWSADPTGEHPLLNERIVALAAREFILKAPATMRMISDLRILANVMLPKQIRPEGT